MSKKIISALLCLVLLLSAAPAVMAADGQAPQTYNYFVTPATSAVEGLTPSGGSVANSHNYSTWASPVESSLTKEGDGYMLVSASGSKLNIEYYDSSFCLYSQKSVELPMPIFGGVYICSDYNFVVCAQNNPEEDNTKEVYRVIRYSKNWENPVGCGLHGANTTAAIDAGSLRFARWGDSLYIRTCHEMYRNPNDGLCHQANLTMLVSVSSMTVTDSLYAVSNIGRGYVSHSFNQFIQVDGGTVIAADHGDAIPRALVVSRYNTSSVSGRSTGLQVFPIADNIGHYNTTGVSLGGFEYSDSHYILAGNSCPQTGGIDQGSACRNIFVTATSKSNFSTGGTSTAFITNYSSSDNINVTTPHLVKTGNNSFALMWGESGGRVIRFCFLDGTGSKISDIYSVEGYLSDCPPIYSDGEIFWVTKVNGIPQLHRLSIEHNYTLTRTEPDCENPGSKLYACTHCSKSFTLTIPAAGHDYDVSRSQPNCSETGVATYTCKTCSHSYTETIEPKEHSYGSPEYVLRTCTEEGYSIYTCLSCGYENKTDYTEALGHCYVRHLEKAGCETEGRISRRCTNCDDEIDVEILPATGHDMQPFNEIPGNCLEKSAKIYCCAHCGAYSSEEGDFGDHSWRLDSQSPGDCVRDGVSVYTCIHCLEKKTEVSEAAGHDYYIYNSVPASCISTGSRTEICYDCGFINTAETPKLPHEFVNNSCRWCGQLAAYSETVSINYRRIKIVLNGEEIIPCDGAGNTVEPFIMSSNGTTYLPLRAIGQALGLNVSWDGVANTVDLSSGGIVKTGAGPAGSSMGLRWAGITYRQIRLFLNDEELDLVNRDGNRVEPFILNSNSSVYLPLRIIGEALGLEVSWDGVANIVYLDSKE